MMLWKKLDLIGRSIVLLSVAFQLTLVSELQSIKQNGDVYHLMENQTWMASMIKNLSTIPQREKVATENADVYSRISLYSEWDKSSLHSDIRVVNTLFILFFLLGSIMTVAGRYLEINQNQS